jgi:PHD/YefM family antitoxin component YafN of YafNO toxin-antitoxin module
MVAYKSNELMSSTDVAKNFGAVLSKLANHEVDKICVLRNNKPEAVVLSALEYEQLRDYRYWNMMSEKEYLQKAHESIDSSRTYSLEEAEKMLDEALARYESLIQSAKKIAKSAKEEYDLLNG